MTKRIRHRGLFSTDERPQSASGGIRRSRAEIEEDERERAKLLAQREEQRYLAVLGIKRAPKRQKKQSKIVMRRSPDGKRISFAQVDTLTPLNSPTEKPEKVLHAAVSDPEIDSALQALTTAFNNVCRMKRLKPAAQRTLLTRFFAVALEGVENDPTRKDQPIPLPEKAPALWAERDKNIKTNPAAFLRSMYEPWIGKGLKRGTIRDLDPALYQAFAVWITRHPEDDIPELSRQHEEIDAILAELGLLYDPDQLRRLGLALQSRLQRNNST